jgi:hypothetical protein
MLSIVRDRPAPAGHDGLLAASDDHRQSVTDTWICSALDRHEKLLTLAAPSDADILTTWPGRSLTALTADDLDAAAKPVKLLQRALAEGYHGLGIVIWADAVITATSRDTHAAIETVLAGLCRDHPVSVLCLYDRAGGGDHLDLAITRHPDWLHDQHLTLRRTADTLLVDGEIDMTNLDVLAGALRALTLSPSSTVRIDLRGVTFLAAAAGRTLDRDTARYRDRGGRVEVHATRHITRILQLLGMHALPGIHLTTPSWPSPSPT